MGLGTEPRRIAIGLLAGVAALAGTLPGAQAGDRIDAEITQTGDGSYTARIETRLPAGWEAQAGMNVTMPQSDESAFAPDLAGPLAQTAEPDAVAWSSVTAPAPAWLLGGQASLRAQVDPDADTAGVVGSLTHTKPLGQYLSASLIDNLAVTETAIGTPDRGQSWEANRSLRLDINPTGTALIARSQFVGADDSLHTFLTAEQDLGGGLDVTTSLSDMETGEPVLSVGARLNRRW